MSTNVASYICACIYITVRSDTGIYLVSTEIYPQEKLVFDKVYNMHVNIIILHFDIFILQHATIIFKGHVHHVHSTVYIPTRGVSSTLTIGCKILKV